MNLWFGADGHLFVIDWRLGDLLEFEADGTFVRVVLEADCNLEGYAFGPDERLYIGDWAGNRVLSVNPDGTDLRTFTRGRRPKNPNSLVFVPVPQ